MTGLEGVILTTADGIQTPYPEGLTITTLAAAIVATSRYAQCGCPLATAASRARHIADINYLAYRVIQKLKEISYAYSSYCEVWLRPSLNSINKPIGPGVEVGLDYQLMYGTKYQDEHVRWTTPDPRRTFETDPLSLSILDHFAVDWKTKLSDAIGINILKTDKDPEPFVGLPDSLGASMSQRRYVHVYGKIEATPEIELINALSFEVKSQFPEIVMQAIIGRPIREIIGHPAFALDNPIESVRDDDNGTIFGYRSSNITVHLAD